MLLLRWRRPRRLTAVTTDKVKVGKNGQGRRIHYWSNGADGIDGKVGITGKER